MHEIDPISRRIYASHAQVPGCKYMYVSYFRLSCQKVFSPLHGLAFSTLCSQFGVLRLNFLLFQIVSGGACSLGIKQHQSHISGVTYFYKLRCMWDYIQEMRMLELLLDARY